MHFYFHQRLLTFSTLPKIQFNLNYLVVFWSSKFSDCLDEILQLQKYLKSKAKSNIKVIAVGLEDDDKKWKELIKSYSEFLHVLGLGKWENKIGHAYGVTATPSYFVLDKQKHIVEKPEDFEALKAFF